MEAIRQTVTVPQNREILIRLPETARPDETAEIIVLFKTKTDSREEKLAAMREAMSDLLFLADLQEIKEDFQFADADEAANES